MKKHFFSCIGIEICKSTPTFLSMFVVWGVFLNSELKLSSHVFTMLSWLIYRQFPLFLLSLSHEHWANLEPLGSLFFHSPARTPRTKQAARSSRQLEAAFSLSAQVLQEVKLTQLPWSLLTPCCSSLSRSAAVVLVRAALRQIRDRREKKEGMHLLVPVSSVSSVLGFRASPGAGGATKGEVQDEVRVFQALRRFHVTFTLEPSSSSEYFYQQGAWSSLTFKSLNSISNKPDVLSVC